MLTCSLVAPSLSRLNPRPEARRSRSALAARKASPRIHRTRLDGLRFGQGACCSPFAARQPFGLTLGNMQIRGVGTTLVRALCLTAMLSSGWASATAGSLSGSSVTAELYFGSDFSDNLFYPPTTTGCLNSGGATVTVSDTAPEFCYFLAGYVSVDLNDTTPELTVTYNTLPMGTIPALTIYLTDTAFEGLTLSKLSDSFPGGLTSDLEGDQLTLTWPGGEADFVPPCETSTCHSATFDLTPAPVPEPSTVLLVAAGALVLCLYRRRSDQPQPDFEGK